LPEDERARVHHVVTRATGGTNNGDAFEEAASEDYHAPLFENLRQVLVGTLKPVPAKELLDDAEEERPSSKRRTAKRESA
jgi:hypothetical protein